MKTIIVATDFSSTATNAVQYAADMALAVKANLVLLHCYQLPVSISEVPVIYDINTAVAGATKELSRLKTDLMLRTVNKVDIQTEVREGSFFSELKDVCADSQPYAVVVGSQGTTAAERFFFGGHTVFAMKHLQWPLIAVPKGVTFSGIRKIALASGLDDDISPEAISKIKALVTDFNAALYIINSGREDEYNPEAVFQAGVLHEELKSLDPHFHFVAGKNFESGISTFVEQNGIDLLIVMPGHYGLVDSLAHKSHTKQLALHTHVALLALHE